MKMITLLVSLLLLATAKAQTLSASITMGPGDSSRLYSRLLNLGHTVEKDARDVNLTLFKTSFLSLDGAISIQCSKAIKGVELGTTCTASINSDSSQDGITAISKGAVGNAVFAFVKSVEDATQLKKSVTSTVGFFQSRDLVDVRFPDGSLRQLPKFKVDCTSAAHSLCDFYIIPER